MFLLFHASSSVGIVGGGCYSGNYYCLTSAISRSIRACGSTFFISADKMANQMAKKEYVCAKTGSETVTNDNDTRREFILNGWDEWLRVHYNFYVV